MAPCIASQVHATTTHSHSQHGQKPELEIEQQHQPIPHVITVHENYTEQHHRPSNTEGIDYSARASWLRAAVLGANDGLVSVASVMIGVAAISRTTKAVIVSGLAGLVAGACSMAIGELVSVYAQHDIELAQRKRQKADAAGTGAARVGAKEEEEEGLPSPWQAAGASALAFVTGGMLPLVAGALAGLSRLYWERVVAVCAVTSLGLVGFGAAGGALGGAGVGRSAARVVVGGWLAMAVSYGVVRLFGLAFGEMPRMEQ